MASGVLTVYAVLLTRNGSNSDLCETKTDFKKASENNTCLLKICTFGFVKITLARVLFNRMV